MKISTGRCLLSVLFTGICINVMAEKTTVAPYGSWSSPITAASITEDTVGLAEIQLDGDNVYWLEQRPDEGGRQVIVRMDAGGRVADAVPADFNSRNRVHEYGGASYLVIDDVIFSSNFIDQKLYRLQAGNKPVALSGAGLRYADCIADAGRKRLICVREDHRAEGEAINTLVALDMEKPDTDQVLFSGTDFVAAPRLSPDGKSVAWISWDHPNMPWDTTTLWRGEIDATGAIANKQIIAGGDNESVLEPAWTADGSLFFVSDRNNWWNLYAWHEGKTRIVHERKAEFSQPPWVFGNSSYVLLSAEQALAIYRENGVARLASIDLRTGVTSEVPTPFVEIAGLKAGHKQVYLLGTSAEEDTKIVRLVNGEFAAIKRARNEVVSKDYISLAQAIEFPVAREKTAHAFYYAPTNPHFRAPTGEKPPLIVKLHGGPTGSSDPSFNPGIQFWTSRGFAFVDINYGGSSGYGRDYRNRLRGLWGVVDLEDTLAATRYLVGKGLADENRLLIRGGSAGGYSVLAAMTFHDVFAAGANYYGISDLEVLVRDTHKFESRYVDSLFGSGPGIEKIYRERSPIHHLKGFSRPLIVFQGLDDEVVPANQSQMIVDALRKKNVPVAYFTYAGEQHGFRKKETIVHSLQAELAFYGKILGFKPAGNLPDIRIDNFHGKN